MFVLVLVIILEDFEKGSFINLFDVLCEVIGVVIIGSVNEEDIFICGLFGQYMLIFVDGKCQSICEFCINGNVGYE